ncbi:DNA-dependent ATPase RDH54 [Sugiyamaella lignohabitans]|uniref:DNA-dependent ATPase RDH54 n=1 Tax=Sugiyamaella lignohabitans TaxID=796027 RepID=A0A167FD72_9ASCO|nr:DNA-dependent ATPase RDH54 [Sugiyamaella lignohabitans]ANB15146.1 DNA-dependent ATPase RDH54 [Sugiyamaella lignohabitans]
MYRRRRIDANSLSTGAAAPFKPLQLNKTSHERLGDTECLESVLSKKFKIEHTPKRHQRQLAALSQIKSLQDSEKKIELPDAPNSARKTFTILWRKYSTKKNKTWEGDGILLIDENNIAKLRNESGKLIAQSKVSNGIKIDDVIRVGFFEVQIDSIKADDDEGDKTNATPCLSQPLPTVSPSLKSSMALIGGSRMKSNMTPRFDPTAPGAIVLPRPRPEPLGKTIIDVVVDPLISSKLRPHQVEGVKFLYQCVMGMNHYAGKGALLADEMGLGKTLLTIALLWTLLKQNPIRGEPPVLKRVLIVCPVTLIANWQKEFRKWLGQDRIGVFVADSKARIRDFTGSKVYSVMIVGYEKVRTLVEELKSVKFDIIVCDEGHRLKNATNKSIQALVALNTEKKIILSGTPIQNDLGEFFVMIDFLNPGILGTYGSFRKNFETPIMRSRQPGALKNDVTLGKQKSEELTQLTQKFILRRTASTLDRYLPPKTESVIFCYPTDTQLQMYKQILDSSELKTYLGSNDTSDHLRAISLLKKICNSSSLIQHNAQGDAASVSASLIAKSANQLPLHSGKIRALLLFLKYIYNDTNEKVVIVSGFTQTLDMIEVLLNYNSMSSLRLDGSTAQSKRQKIVDQFNQSDQSSSFAFLLSSRSGGVGLNLVGASRLFLFDTDWNPSIDLQAMARIHRDGQKKPVFIYRLLLCGTIDEKIYQRQVTKQGLADRFMSVDSDKEVTSAKDPVTFGDSNSSDTFSADDLRDLFVLHQDTPCNTHDILECGCLKSDASQDPEYCEGSTDASICSNQIEHISNIVYEGSDSDDDLGGWMSAKAVAQEGIHIPRAMKKKDRLKGLFDYRHIDVASDVSPIEDSILLKIISLSPNTVSFVFTKSTVVNENASQAVEEVEDPQH